MYYLFVVGRAIALSLPRNVSYLVARILALCQYYISKKDRASVLFNLEALVKEPAERARCARETFVNFAYYLVDFFRYEKLDEDFISRYVRVSGREHLDAGFTAGRGVIGLSAHIGNYEFGAAIVSHLGYRIHALALVHKNKKLNAYFDGQRKMTGVDVIPLGSFAKHCIQLLKSNQFVVFLGDRDFGGSSIALPLCGRRAHIPRGPAFFALKTGACILPVFCIRERKYFYHLVFEKPITVTADGGSEQELMVRYAEMVEKYITKYPEQWYLFEKYWVD